MDTGGLYGSDPQNLQKVLAQLKELEQAKSEVLDRALVALANMKPVYGE